LQVRKTVVKDLPALCQESGEHVDKILDILAQLLLQSIDAQEKEIVLRGLMIFIKNPNYTKGLTYFNYFNYFLATFDKIFMHMCTTTVSNWRGQAMQFLNFYARITIRVNLLTVEMKDLIFENAQKVYFDFLSQYYTNFTDYVRCNWRRISSINVNNSRSTTFANGSRS
jgi:hypothetical protein